MPEAQTLLIVSELTSLGIPALICAWREGIWPWPACSTWPMITCWTSSAPTSARSSAALIAMPPSSVASSVDEAAAHLPDRRAGGAEDDGLGHGATSPDLAGQDRRAVYEVVRFRGWVVHVALLVTARQAGASSLPNLLRVIVQATTALPADADADTVVIGILEGEGSRTTSTACCSGLIDAGEAKAKHRHLAVAMPPASAGCSSASASATSSTASACASPPRRARARPRARRADGCAGRCRTRSVTRSPRRSSRARCCAPTASTASRQAAGGARADVDALVVSAHDDLADVGRRGARSSRGPSTPRATCRTRRPTRWRRATSPTLRRALAELEGVTVEVEGRDGPASARHGLVRRRRTGLARGAGADHAAVRAARTRADRCSASSARP